MFRTGPVLCFVALGGCSVGPIPVSTSAGSGAARSSTGARRGAPATGAPSSGTTTGGATTGGATTGGTTTGGTTTGGTTTGGLSGPFWGSVGLGPTGVVANFREGSPSPDVAQGIDGGCLVSYLSVAGCQGALSAGTLMFADVDGGALGSVDPTSCGFYSGTGLGGWMPGEFVTVAASGAQVPAFSATLLVPGPVGAVQLPTGTAPSISLGQDLTVTWAPDGISPGFALLISQQTGAETGVAQDGGMVTLLAPNYVVCNVPDADGTVTVPHALFVAAGFVSGQQGSVSVNRFDKAVLSLDGGSIVAVSVSSQGPAETVQFQP